MNAPDPVALTQDLIRCPSVTPADEGALDVLERALAGLGFACTRLPFGHEPDGPVDNLFATLAGGPGPHFAFAGHSDVVPAGDFNGWSEDPFAAEVKDGFIVGRGAADMKGALAAMIAATARHLGRGPLVGRLSFIITGDEEGPATFGTTMMLDWMEANGLVPDMCLVGEPTSQQRLGDMMKIGRRGSLNAWITVNGAQGHVGYPHMADNPITRLVAIVAELKARVLDKGNDWFQASNLEITDLSVGNPATNLIPAQARARLNIRFNNEHTGASLSDWIRDTVAVHAPASHVEIKISGEAFLTEPGALSSLVSAGITDVTGRSPVLSTTGGTSDARFIRRLCPVVEFGLPGQSMHKVDEHAAVADVTGLAAIYEAVLARALL
ncbi:succinyl-diaminopimelate desuccinylase [Sandarakinorhabdus limnophila]|uniref:succinyl-diaminopimelate desuccinylase n=1 Tax=Sandarakinorhabdus limnophila TaxID=210512 RepID=UPI0031380994